jgi:hypothetical protein
MKMVSGHIHCRNMTDSVKTKWILGMPVLNNIFSNNELFVNVSCNVNE